MHKFKKAMRKAILLTFALLYGINLSAWWDPGHLVTAMIAYMNLEEPARQKVDSLTQTLARDYEYVNHFIVTGAWPDDLKTEGVHAFNTWHYTNIPYNPDAVALPPQPEVDVIWAINESVDILNSPKAKAIDKARFLAFLVHFAADLHQPLHSTSMFTNELPGGNRGGNEFPLEGNWRNLHMLWDDGCGFLSDYNDIRPYGEPQEPLTEAEIDRLRDLAEQITQEFPKSQFTAADTLDPEFWALESHNLAVRYGYRGLNSDDRRSRNRYLDPGEEPTEYYLSMCQDVVRKQLALGGYRLAGMLNDIFGEQRN